MLLKELYLDFISQLQSIYSVDEATAITKWTFEKFTAIEQLNDALSQLLRHKPVQYVLGEAWFYNLRLTVNENVLIPRPETEELVEWLINDNKKNPSNTSILDIGTGSGCIPIAIKKNLPAVILTAIDVEEGALALATQNAMEYDCPISFLQIDILDESQWVKLGSFDIIISNPPYIPVHAKNEMARNVLDYEPHIALFVPNNDPFIFYKKIAAFGKTHLKPGGSIYVETHGDDAKKVAAIFSNSCYNAETKNDISGKERMVKAILTC